MRRATLWAVEPTPGPPPASLRVAEIGRETLAPLVAAMGPDGDLAAERLDRGCRAFAGWRDGGLVAFGWLSTGPEWIGELGLEIRPAPGEGYIWNCVTLAPHRRQGHFQALVRCVAARAHGEGLSRLWIGSIDTVGTGGLRAAGWTPVLRFTIRKLLWFRRLAIWSAEEADPDLVRAGRRSVFAGGQPVLGGSALGRAYARRH
ncbi:MAG: GNAT family N-acetyltransferase [Chloroflexota bacterium]